MRLSLYFQRPTEFCAENLSDVIIHYTGDELVGTALRSQSISNWRTHEPALSFSFAITVIVTTSAHFS